MNEFEQFVNHNKNELIVIRKITDKEIPEYKRSIVPNGKGYLGHLSLIQVSDSEYGDGFRLALDGGWTFCSSLVRKVTQESKNKWLVETLNSHYMVEGKDE